MATLPYAHAALPVRARRAWLWRALLALALAAALAGLAIGASWLADRARLARVADAAFTGRTEAARLANLTAWVYRNQGFAKNPGYFIWPRLDATPVQVLESGGDCEDKSKLTVALLREEGVDASLAMIRPCADCAFVHTVALARTARGWTVLDPVYDIVFPAPDGSLLPVEALRRDSALLAARVTALARAQGPASKIAHYPLANHDYRHLTTLNWDKNAATGAVAATIRAAGGEPWRTPRPFILDDPKQFFAALFLGLAAALAALGLLLRRAARRP